MMRRNQGYITLTVTSFVLVAALILILGSYKQVFFQIKRAQNEVKNRQEHWLAEGGLECIYTRAHVDKISAGSVTGCSSQAGLTLDLNTSAAGRMAVAKVGTTMLEKEIRYGGSLGAGALQTSADMFLRGANAFDTPDPGKYTSDGWECVAARYKSAFRVSGTIENKGVVHGDAPWSGFNNRGKDCKLSHRSTSGGTGAGNISTNDFLKDATVAPFENFYGVPLSESEKVRDNGNFHILTGTAIASGTKILSNCGAKLKGAIEAGKEFIWVQGGCEISASDYPGLVTASSATPNGVTLVVSDGPISLMSDGSSGDFKGVLFHISPTYTPALSDWGSLPGANPYINPVGASNFPADVRASASYFQSGSFTFSGGQYLDSSGHYAIFNNAISLSFNKDVIDYARSKNSPPQWLKGSWNDF
ncbi:hypothetical protein TUMSATVNIG1_27550 [Vibrio nigripulchritudo]|uniref:hypothetical protein n=1 Tax=Vibrio nigripulchritudo TaxID=28173 RepID=UPI00190C252D|nr:hypothetical protein [Vibrio nigripulchritudo]BCL70790.1 hypothetical protein VNTUMSATTG_27270 [Vibrio nigripulchritudo]BDU32146.1 hypothetical protein TUMSATVNIG1_27550 [Vibrio nigripulchritudo]